MARTAATRTAVLLALGLSLAACGGGGGDDDPPAVAPGAGGGDGAGTDTAGTGGDSGPGTSAGGTLVGSGVWRVDGTSYSAGLGASSMETNGEIGVVSAFTVGFDPSRGARDGSSVTMSFNRQGAGLYEVVDSVAQRFAVDPQARVIDLSVTIGTAVAPLAATGYRSTSGSVRATVDEGGRYRFSTEAPITLEKVDDIGTGVPGAGETAVFEMRDLFDPSGG